MQRLIIFLSLVLLTSTTVAAQQAERVGVEPSNANAISHQIDGVSSGLRPERGAPRWQRAAVVGAVTGGLGFAVLHVMFQSWNPQNSMAHDLALGVIGGAVVAGGTVALYDWICTPGSASDNAGLCSPLPTRRFRDASRSVLIPRL